MSADLIPIESVNALELFTGGGLDCLLQQIEAEVIHTPVDLGSEKGRKVIASTAYKVARSKTVIDDAGKALVADWKQKAAEVDAGRRKAREFLDDLRDRVRQPLTEWEEERIRIEAEEKLRGEIEAAHSEALELNALLERQREVERREAELARQEAERLERERLEREAVERKEREERIAREAEERAKQQAESALERERLARKQAEQRAQEAAERAERDRIAAEERAKREEKEAVERERLRVLREQEERERIRREAEERKRKEDEARAANQANRNRINRAILDALMGDGIEKEIAIKVIKLVASGVVPSIKITY